MGKKGLSFWKGKKCIELIWGRDKSHCESWTNREEEANEISWGTFATR